jgi:hypothetical protein
MDRQAIDVHGRIAFSNANCALPKAPMAEGPVLAQNRHADAVAACPVSGDERTSSGTQFEV